MTSSYGGQTDFFFSLLTSHISRLYSYATKTLGNFLLYTTRSTEIRESVTLFALLNFFMNPQQPEEIISQTVVPNKRHLGLIIGVIAGILILSGGGVAFAAYKGWITLPYNFLGPKAPTLQEIEKAISEINSADITMGFAFESRDKQEGTIVLKTKQDENTEEDVYDASINENPIMTYASSMIQDAKIEGSVKINFERGEKTGSRGNIALSYESSGTKLSLDSDFLYKDASPYIKINQLPALFFDPSPILNEWIRFNKDDIANMFETPYANMWESIREDERMDDEQTTKTETDPLETVSDAQKEFAVLRRLIAEKNVLEIQSVSRMKKRNGEEYWNYRITVNAERLIEAYLTAIEQRPPLDSYKLLDDEAKTELQNEEFKNYLTSLLSIMSCELDVDMKTKQPIEIRTHMVYATEASQNLDDPKEYVIDFSVSASNINQPSVIEVPSEFTTPSDIMYILSGTTKEENDLDNQFFIISEIRRALKLYQSEHSAYPNTLNELIGLSNTYQRLKSIPNDQFTNEPFVYAVNEDGSDYTLVWQSNITDTSASFQAWVEGANTANSKTISIEGAKLIDADGDGLTLYEETRYETSDEMEDTDGDGFSDKAEIDAGYDPLTGIGGVDGLHFAQARNSERWDHTNTIVNLVERNRVEHRGTWTCEAGALPTSTTPIASKNVNPAGYDLCKCLIPAYANKLPYDPSASGASFTSCKDYSTGYTIVHNASDNRFTVSAPSAELGVTISITQ